MQTGSYGKQSEHARQRKTCRRCGVEQPSSSFKPMPRLRDGLNSWCRDCMRAAGKASRAIHGAKYNAARRKLERRVTCAWCVTEFVTTPNLRTTYCSADCYKRATKALYRNKYGRRRAAEVGTDVTRAFVDGLLRARKCAACGCYMTTAQGPRQKHVDHIVPLVVGGTHTVGNLRVICRTCNLTRPKDGRDVQQITLWGRGEGVGAPLETPQVIPQSPPPPQSSEARKDAA